MVLSSLECFDSIYRQNGYLHVLDCGQWTRSEWKLIKREADKNDKMQIKNNIFFDKFDFLF